jgi:hypothetical protein
VPRGPPKRPRSREAIVDFSVGAHRVRLYDTAVDLEPSAGHDDSVLADAPVRVLGIPVQGSRAVIS